MQYITIINLSSVYLELSPLVNFYAPISKDRGHIVLPMSVCLVVCPSLCLSVCTNLTWKLNIFPLLSSIHISWYQGQGHLQRSGSNIRVMFLKRWVFQGHKYFTNTSCLNLDLSRPWLLKYKSQWLETLFYFSYNMTPILWQGAVWGYAALLWQF